MELLKMTVIYLFLSVRKCSLMSLNEIEEFSNFLEKTAQLDEILKKGPNPDDDYDEDEAISDHAWEESGRFEGDLVLNERQRRLIVENVAEGLSRNGLTDSTKRWPDNEVIYYIQREHFSSDQVDAIQNGIDDLVQASCVKFRPYKKGDRDAVVIQGSRRGCFSQVGYQGGYQVLNLSGRHPVGRGCFRHGTVVHELLHTLGFYHMQSSPDRDDYINVMWENIIEPAKHNFRKYNSFSVSDFGVGYDYDSVLHYSRRAFSSNGQDTLVPKQSGASIGQRTGLSDKDTQKLNKMYCDADNNAAAEESTHKPPVKKKKPKNKPFEGHGIGYHQGKTVVIKLPAAETYKLADTPTFHLFDHFSKAPQAVPSAVIEGPGTGEKVIYSYTHKPYEFNVKDFEKPADLHKGDKIKHSKVSLVDYDSYYNEPKIIEPNAENGDKFSTKAENSTQPVHKAVEKGDSGEISYDLNDAFERLGKIIKTHVYPSQTPDLNRYKNLDYSKYYNPQRKYEAESEIVKVDKAFASKLIPLSEIKMANVDDKEKKKNILGFKQTLETHDQSESEELSAEVPGLPYHKEYVLKDYDSTYGTSFVKNKEPNVVKEKFITPEYTTSKFLSNKHDYSGLYNPKDEKFARNGKHIVFGYIVPLNEAWYNKDYIEMDNRKYDQESYTYPESKTSEKTSLRLIQYAPESADKVHVDRLPINKPSYSLFGAFVPLTQKWYKVDYNPHESSYLLKNPESGEDYR